MARALPADLDAALDALDRLPTGATRNALAIARVCGGDDVLQQQVCALLAASAQAPTMLAGNAADLAASLLADEPLDDPLTPSHIGGYELHERVGEGGMGVVYRARRCRGDFDHEVAIKLLSGRFGSGDLAVRFAREQRVLAALNHAGIARLYDGGVSDDGRPYIVMEFVQGEPIDSYCDNNALSVPARLALVRQVADALAHAHRNLIVHRDLKPSNVLVTPAGRAVLLDFGIAKLLDDSESGDLTLASGTAPLTPRYAAPEQRCAGHVTVATDVYQLGVLMSELLCGVAPRPMLADKSRSAAARLPSQAIARHPPVTAERIARQRAMRPGKLRRALRGDLDAIVAQATRLEPTRRYLTMDALRADLCAYADGAPVRARAAGRMYRLSRFVHRHRVAAGGVLVAAAMLVMYAATLTVHNQRIGAALDVSRIETQKAEEVSQFLVELFASSDPDHTPGQSATVPEILAAGERKIGAALNGAPSVRAHMLDVLGRIYFSRGDYERSANLLQDALSEHAGMGSQASPDAAQIRVQYGIALAATGEFERANVEYARAIEALRTAGGQHAALAEALNASGRALKRLGRRGEARAAFAESIDLLRALPVDEAGELPVVLNNLASLHAAQGDYAQAERLFRDVVDHQEAALGPNHSYYAVSLENLARIQLLLGRYTEAHERLTRVLKLKRDNLGPDHPYVAQTLHSLGALAHLQNDPDTAIDLLEQALVIHRQSGQRAPLAATLRTLGEAWLAAGDTTKARDSLTQTLSIDRELYPDGHARHGRDLALLGAVSLAEGDTARAEGELSQALALLDAESRTGANAFLVLARLRAAQDRLADAVRAAEHALAVRIALLPPDHPHVADARAIANELRRAGSKAVQARL